MIIQQIQMTNFGPFHDKHVVSFESDGSGVHLIRGNNGQGKTSIQRAILWGLYGKVTDRKGREIQHTSLINRTAVKEFYLNMEVKLFFKHEDANWILTRKIGAKYHRNNDYIKNMTFYLVKNGEPKSNPQLLIDRILPYDVQRFFFFDGEMLRDYEELLDQSSRSMKILKNSIEYVLGIPYLRIARDDMREILKIYERDKSKLLKKMGNKSYDELAEELDKCIKEIERLEKLIDSLNDQYDKIEFDIADKKRQLSDMKEVQELAMERLELEKEIKGLESEENDINIKIKSILSELYKTILVDVSENLIKKLEIKHEEIMGKYNKKQQLLKEKDDVENGIKNQKCRLCGNILNPKKLKEFTKKREELIIQIDSLTQIPEPDLKFDESIKILNRIKNNKINREEIKKNSELLLKKSHEIASLKGKLNKIEENLLNVDKEEPFNLEKEIQDLSLELTRIEYEIKDQKELLEKELSNRSEINQKLKSINERDFKILQNRIELTKKLSDLFEETISIYRNKRRKDVEEIATKIFKQIRSKEDYDSLSINDNFGMSVITKLGTVLDKAEWRSAGEEQIVALALIGALNKCAQIRAPIFMDTPFGRLDIEHGERVLTFIPSMSEQVVILVTDREFRRDDEKYLKGKISSDYTLIHRGEERGSHIIQTSTVGGLT